ncbi:MAG: ribbon-helix-helix domain-containing protein [Candidatus Woesearchaeota archaeon]|nr:ribbon-helix-helix domain-containing protein [Candidatus Woesearchaeota archaeon]
METISMKIDKDILHKVDSSLKEFNFNTRTEFIRAAMRNELERLERKKLLKKLAALRGSVKRKTTDADRRKIREEAFEDLIREKGWLE